MPLRLWGCWVVSGDGFDLLDGVGCPGSLHGLDVSRLPRMYGRLERSVVSRITMGPNRFTSSLNIIRVAMTLRCICGAPRSHVI